MGARIESNLMSSSIPEKNIESHSRKRYGYEYENYTRQATGVPYPYII